MNTYRQWKLDDRFLQCCSWRFEKVKDEVKDVVKRESLLLNQNVASDTLPSVNVFKCDTYCRFKRVREIKYRSSTRKYWWKWPLVETYWTKTKDLEWVKQFATVMRSCFCVCFRLTSTVTNTTPAKAIPKTSQAPSETFL